LNLGHSTATDDDPENRALLLRVMHSDDAS
jgi:hypothetical protein